MLRKKFVLFIMLLITSCNLKDNNEIPKYTIEDLINVELAAGGSYSSDHENVIYISNKTGIFNVWIYNIKNKASKLLIKSDQNIESAFYNKYGKIYYTQDNGGDRNYSIYEYDAATNASKLIIGNKNASSEVIRISKNGEELIYIANNRDRKLNDLYSYNFKTGKVIKIWQAKEGRSLAFFMEDKNLVITKEILGSNNEALYVYDLSSNKEKKLTSKIGQYKVTDYEEYNIYVISNFESDFKQGYKIDTSNGKAIKIIDTQWDVLDIKKSFNGKYWFYKINERGKTVVKLFSDHFKTRISNPLGLEGEFDIKNIEKDEQFAIFSINKDMAPPILFTWDINNNVYSKINDSLPSNIKEENLVAAKPIIYKSRDGHDISGYLYMPKTQKPKNGFPLIVNVHGGPNYQFYPYFSSTTQYLVNQGYAVFAPDYRGSDGYGVKFMQLANINGVPDHGKTPLFDVIDGKNYILKQYKDLDSDRTAIMGGSWGGYMTLCALAFTPNEFKAGIDIVGPSNLVTVIKSFLLRSQNHKGYEANNSYEIFGNPYTQKEHLEKRSPLFFADQIKAPLLILHGRNDQIVAFEESNAIYNTIKKNKGVVEMHVYENEGHGFQRTENRIDYTKRMVKFLDKYL